MKVREKDDPLNTVYESREYKEICKKQKLDFAMIIDVEITSMCNLRCIMCTRQVKTARRMGEMDPKLFYKITDQAAAYSAKLIRFSGYGEALTHKDFIPFLRYAKSKGLLTHLTTNGLLLNEKLILEIVDTPLDKIKFSFQGTDEDEYNRMRATKSYKALVENIRMLKRIRDEKNSRLPIIQVATTVLDESDAQIGEFYRFWEGIADNIYHLPTVTWRLEDTEFGRRHARRVKAKILDTVCMEVNTKLSVWNDGKVSACCGDHQHLLLIGDVNKNTLKEIWDGPAACALRELLRVRPPSRFTNGDRERYRLCAECTSMYIEREE